ncbi:MAG: HD domain-containing protein [Phycisphaerales bacterium]|nr:HD domain-containing protein [Phycisphaerales bacterium]
MVMPIYFDFIPQPPLWRIDWPCIETENRSWLSRLEATPQDAEWHAEGNVLVHTKMVCEALAGLEEWRSLDEAAREIVFVAALMHDIGKPDCTKTQDGRIVSHRIDFSSLAPPRLFVRERPLPQTSHPIPN